jgi:hypothetical protein
MMELDIKEAIVGNGETFLILFGGNALTEMHKKCYNHI